MAATQADVAMALEELKAAAEAETTIDDSIVALLTGIKKQLDDALTAGDPAAVIAAVKTVSTTLGFEQKKLTDAVIANTPAEPPPPAEPVA